MAVYRWQCKECSAIVEVERKMDLYRLAPEEPCKCGCSDFQKLLDASLYRWYYCD